MYVKKKYSSFYSGTYSDNLKHASLIPLVCHKSNILFTYRLKALSSVHCTMYQVVHEHIFTQYVSFVNCTYSTYSKLASFWYFYMVLIP